MTTNNRKAWLPLYFCLAIIAGIFIGFYLKATIPGRNFFTVEKASPLEEIVSLVKNKYVDNVDMASINDSAIAAILARLDPHSAFIPAKDLQAINDDINGSFYGIGVEYNMITDTLHVINVLDGGPAATAGVNVGDQILKAGDSIISGVKRSASQVRSILTGGLGTETILTALRNKKTITLKVKRGSIPITSIDASYMIAPGIGFIRLNRFSSQTYSEFMPALMALKKAGMKELILDLRDNGGGVLDEAVEIADELLAGDKLITYTEGEHMPRKEYRCRRQGQWETGGLVILCNQGTASASEILMGACQDWDRGTIIGKNSFGKGLVQEQYMLRDGSALRLTVARYYTPLGRSIQRNYTAGNAAYYRNAIDRMGEADSSYADTTSRVAKQIFTTKAGKKLHAANGIMPDVIVVSQQDSISKLTRVLLEKGIISQYGYYYFMNNPSIKEKYKKADGFVQNYLFQEDNWLLFQSMAARDSIDVSKLQDAEKQYVLKVLKYSLARQLYRTEGFYEASNMDDSTIKKAVEILQK